MLRLARRSWIALASYFVKDSDWVKMCDDERIGWAADESGKSFMTADLTVDGGTVDDVRALDADDDVRIDDAAITSTILNVIN